MPFHPLHSPRLTKKNQYIRAPPCWARTHTHVHTRGAQIKEAVDAAAAASAPIKLVFLTSPGNPTGTLVPVAAVRALAEHPGFGGIIVVDEAYIDFAEQEQKQVADDVSAVGLVKEYANVCVMQTLSKSFGLAAIR